MQPLAKIALWQGGDRAENLRQTLALVIDDLDWHTRQRVLIKPNLVMPEVPLAVTHADALAVLLEEIRKRFSGLITIGEGCALMPTSEAYQMLGFDHLAEFYQARLVDLNEDEWHPVQIYDQSARLIQVRLAKTVLQSDCRISLAIPKTHDTVLVTLGIKNMVMGSLINRRLIKQKDRPYWQDIFGQILHGHGNGWGSDKVAMHQGYAMMNINLTHLARLVKPHLTVLDGYLAMEGEGPTNGAPVLWCVAAAGTDPLAVDVFAARQMGFALEEVGYLKYCAEVGLGCEDLDRVQVLGNALPDQVARQFKRHSRYHEQSQWFHPQAIDRLHDLICLEGVPL